MHTHQKSCDPVATIGLDIGKNTFHLVGLDKRGAIAMRGARQSAFCGSKTVGTGGTMMRRLMALSGQSRAVVVSVGRSLRWQPEHPALGLALGVGSDSLRAPSPTGSYTSRRLAR
jgi:hypothetical protein